MLLENLKEKKEGGRTEGGRRKGNMNTLLELLSMNYMKCVLFVLIKVKKERDGERIISPCTN